MGLLIGIFVVYFFIVGVSMEVGGRKGRGFLGFWLGFLLGPIGLLIVYLMPDHTKPTDPEPIVVQVEISYTLEEAEEDEAD